MFLCDIGLIIDHMMGKRWDLGDTFSCLIVVCDGAKFLGCFSGDVDFVTYP